MKPVDLAGFALRAILTNRRRSGLSLVGVVIGVVAVVTLTAIGEGALRYVTDQFRSLGSSLVIVAPGRNETTGGLPAAFGGVPNDLTFEDALAIQRQVRAVKTAVPIALSSAPVSQQERRRQSPIIGATAALARLQRYEIAYGSFLPETEIDRGGAVAVLGHTVARELFGNASPLGETVRVGGWRMRVIGVIAERGTQFGMQVDETVFVPTATAMRMANKSSLSRIILELNPRSDPTAAIERVKEVLVDRHDEEDFTCISQDAVIESLGSILHILTLVVAGIASISLAVAGIGIMNVMLVSVSERTAEVGLLKAVGASRRQVLLVFLVEAALLSGAGGLLGLFVGEAIVHVGRLLYPAVDAQTPLWAIGAVLGLSFATGVVFGVLPAWRAAGLDPVAALRSR
ncbi:MAG: ABC transporter permease [Spirochaetaceae bacterium]|nr:ABC transporter permease [Myxococcales bacterium]MCB9726243.1 ABC transporter permease [Spirochaetaceae bacterium]